MADASVQDAGAAQRAAAAGAAGAGFSNTINTSSQGAATPSTTQKQLLGQ
jgi:hypothetical protein